MAGLSAIEARAPLARISRASRTGAAAASAWKVTEPAPASTYRGAQRSASSIIRWQSSGVSVARASASTTGTPSVRFGTKWLSITSTWSQSAPSTAFASSARRAKSADRMLGLICAAMPQACHVPGRLPAPVRPSVARGRGAAVHPRAVPGCPAVSRAAPEVGMNRLGGVRRTAVAVVCGRRSKWLVLVLWLVVLVVAAPLAQKLTDAQDNDAPVLAARLGGVHASPATSPSEFRPEQIPAVVVYARPGGLTAQDRRAIDQDVRQIERLRDHGIRGAETRGPVFDRPADPRAAQIYVPITMDATGWQRIAPAVDSIRDRVGPGGDGLAVHITGPGGTAADSAKAFEGIDSTLLFAAMASSS